MDGKRRRASDRQPHPSRKGWPDEMCPDPPEPPVHSHRLPGVVRAAIAGLSVAVLCLLLAVGLLAVYVYQQQQYIQGKGVQRDRENAQMQERLRQAQCDLLDTFPEGGLLDRARTKYHCGPGIPLDQLTPQEQAQLSGRNPAVAQQLPSGVESIPGLPGGAVQQPTPQPYFPTPGVAEPPATVPYPPGFPPPDPVQPTNPPLVDLGPVTCGLVGVGC